MTIRIDAPGFGTTLQDAGRPGFAHLGVPRSGPVDRSSAALANRLAGNPVDAAVIETLGGLVVTATAAATVATPESGRTSLSAGERLRVDVDPTRRWTHLAVRGGFLADPVLGSVSNDTLSGLGPPPPAAGTHLAVGPDPGTDLPADFAPRHRLDESAVPLWDPPARDARLVGDHRVGRWRVTEDVSRVGLRLRPSGVPTGDPVVPDARVDRPRPSGGLVLGAVQLTPSGEAIVMLADHPTTGGYPLIGVVDPDHLDRVAQTPVGSEIVFRRVDPRPLGTRQPASG